MLRLFFSFLVFHCIQFSGYLATSPSRLLHHQAPSLASSNSIVARLPGLRRIAFAYHLLCLASSRPPASAGSAARARLPLHHTPEFSTVTPEAAMAGSQEEAAPQPPAASGGSVVDGIMPHLLNLYGSSATARDFEIYAPNATYEDPLLRAHGVKQIKSAFYTLPKLFGESKITEYTIVQENPMGPGKTEVVIENKQHYKVLGKPVDLMSLIRLLVEDGKVVNHQDWWNRKPLKNKDTVGLPLVGRLAEAGRRGVMLLTHALMGFGKDPKPTQH